MTDQPATCEVKAAMNALPTAQAATGGPMEASREPRTRFRRAKSITGVSGATSPRLQA